MALDICQIGDTILRQTARALSKDEIRSTHIQTLIGDMRDAMRQASGVGLAAPQIGQPFQLAVIEDREASIERLSLEARTEREREPIPLHVIINPRLYVQSFDSVMFFEGCLSVEGLIGLVARARRVRVEYLNEHAESVIRDARGWYARILQHEIDHMHGCLYLDCVLSRSLMTTYHYEMNWKDKTIAQVCAAFGIRAS